MPNIPARRKKGEADVLASSSTTAAVTAAAADAEFKDLIDAAQVRNGSIGKFLKYLHPHF